MFHHVKLLIWCVLIRHYYAARLPLSPCPNVFSYEEEPQLDRWYGLVTFASNSELTGLDLKIQLDRPSQLLVSWDGDVRTKDNTNYIIRNPFHTQKVGEMVKSRIMVKYYPPAGAPNVVRIDINSKTLCYKESNINGVFSQGVGLSGETTERFDPSFNENDNNYDNNNNRGQNYGSSSSANRPNYNEFNNNGNGGGNSNRPVYTGNNEPTYNHNPPAYNFPEYNTNGGSNSPNYNQNGGGGSIGTRPNDYENSNSGFSNSGFNVEPVYTGNNRPQQTSNTQGNGFSNQQPSNGGGVAGSQSIDSSPQSIGNGPVVTTLTLPTNMQNKTNIDQIVQIIKNQLEQQQLTANQGNKTVIVAVVNPNPTSSSSQEQTISNSIKTSIVTSTPKYRTTTIKTSTKSSSSHRSNNADE